MNVEIRVSASAEAASREAAELLAGSTVRGGHVALSGGSTPRPAYEAAARLAPDWSRVEVWWADERCVPPSDERSNYRLVRESLLDRLDRGAAIEHRMRGEVPPDRAADLYEGELKGVVFDLVLLGLGADGHTASLFPNDPALDELRRRAVPVRRADVDRVTLTIPVLNAAEALVFLVVGEEKAAAAARAFAGKPDPATPASLVRSASGTTIALLDRAAAGDLPN
ncbi:MAG: 6-phosphogluconolactonase [Actinomycetota bacterium]|nr:6-phosphogluconolactonase [Actinomycetota bacterium]